MRSRKVNDTSIECYTKGFAVSVKINRDNKEFTKLGTVESNNGNSITVIWKEEGNCQTWTGQALRKLLLIPPSF